MNKSHGQKIFLVLLLGLAFISSVFANSTDNNAAPTITSTNTSNTDAAEPARRAFPSPYDSVFPVTEYPGPTIGVANSTATTPLNVALWDAFPVLKDLGINVYGWINPEFNLSTANNSNTPMGYNLVPNNVELEQAVLHFERFPDTVQTQHMDWGLVFTNLFGTDYRYTTAQGIFSDQLLQHNNLYGYDPVEAYAQLYVPSVAQGMVITVGRYFSPADIESALAPYNYLFTHSLMFSYDAATQTGINSTIKFNNQWTALLGIHAGDDVAPWAAGAHIPTALTMLRWVSNSNNDSLWGGADSFNGGKFKDDHDNLQQFNLTWSHRFTPGFFIATEGYYIYQYDSPKGGTCNFGPVESYGGGGGCGPIIPGFSSEIGAVNYIELKGSDKDFFSFRTDYLDDKDGERTGFATQYMSFTLGLTHQFFPLFEVRPEVRYEFAFDQTPYDNGTKKNQTSFNIDAILRF